MTGDLEGCFYIHVDDYKCEGNGFYREKGRDHFVGAYKGKPGSFWTTYKFDSKYEDCPEEGEPLGLEIWGLCKHPITEGAGEGVFEGADGILYFVDLVKQGKNPYRGRLEY